jgi:cyclopropane-fatty-acyl-phospholipid synthase
MARKLERAIAACQLRPGMRVLDIGGAGAPSRNTPAAAASTSRRSRCRSARAVPARADRQSASALRGRASTFPEYRAPRPYDAIVNMGVTEHLPDYGATLAHYQDLLVPAGACTSTPARPRRFASTSFIHQHVFPGDASTLCLHDYVSALADTSLELVELPTTASRTDSRRSTGRGTSSATARRSSSAGRAPVPEVPPVPLGLRVFLRDGSALRVSPGAGEAGRCTREQAARRRAFLTPYRTPCA